MQLTALIPAQARLLVVALLTAVAAYATWQWQANAYGLQLAEQARAHEHTLGELARAAARQLQAQQDERLALEQRLATHDATKHQELTDAQSENERLRRLYSGADGERQRLRIEARIARADATVLAATCASSLGDGESVELSGAAGRTVWDIRGGVISDRVKLTYLQGYVCELRPDLAACK